LKTLLNIPPAVGFEAGIEKFVAWVNQQSVAGNNYKNSLLEMQSKGLLK
jgi:hypothetical protein